MLGGMWGLKKNNKIDLLQLINLFISTQTDYKYGVDYIFFNNVLYPLIKDFDSLVHDDFFDKKPFPTKREGLQFVGQVFDENDQPDVEHLIALKRGLDQIEDARRILVTLDISVLGLGHTNIRARTGIYRVVDNLLKVMVNRSDIRLNLVTHANLIEASREFVRSQQTLISFGEVNDLSSVPSGCLLHSPFYQLPPASGSGPRVLTVYDLISIKCPQLFELGDDIALRNTIASLGPDDFVTVISESTKADLMAFAPHIPASRIVVTPLAADKKIFYPCRDPQEKSRVCQKYHLKASDQYMLSVATLEPRKNIAHLIRAFVRFIREDQISTLKLVLVGTKGWKFDAIFDELTLVGDIRERIVITGFVPDEDMAALYSNAMAFAYPSLYEGFGLPPLEAMQCGTPVISSDNSSLPEVVGDAGILLPAKDESALVSAIRALYANEQLRLDLSQKGIARAATFTWERCVDQTVATYKMAYAHWQTLPASVVIAPRPILIDAVFFQQYQTGIARVWRSLLREWAATDFGKRLVVLDRVKTAPRFDGIKYIDVPRYDYADTDNDRAMLQHVCDAENAAVFISSYYTTPLTTPSVFMVHDMIPELFGADVVNTPMWREKHYGVRHASHFIAV
ncbi:MAG: glycosyltransferase, partial [Pseudomonadota bacterium]